MKRLVIGALLLSITGLPNLALACDPQTGERDQRVALDWNGQSVAAWTVEYGAIKTVTLPNGVAFGVRLDPPEQEKLQSLASHWDHVPEMVKISLFDLGAPEPVELTYTYAGTNSIQGYGADGGADNVALLGDRGITMTLLKPVCLASASSK